MSELYQLPDGWDLRELKSVCTFINGRAYKQAELLGNGKYPVLRVGNFFTNNSWYYSDLELPKEKYCEQGDLLYAWSASFGPKIWDGVKSIFHYHIWKIEPDYSVIIKQYLYWLLFWDVNQIKADFGSGTTMIHITKGAIESRIVPLPPLAEQKRILQKLGALFERIDKAIVLLQKNIDAADNFMNSILNDVFSDLEQNYGTQTILDGVNIGARAGYKPRLIAGKVPFIGMCDIDDESGISTKYVLEDYEKVSKGKVKFEKNAVLVGKITPCTQNNKTTIVPAEIDGGFATTEVYALHSKENMYPFYLNYYMRSKNVNDYLVSTMVGATGRQRVPSESIRALSIPIPPIFIQEKTVLYFDNISIQTAQVKSAQQQKMQNLLDLKSSILDQAFHGKL